MSATNCYWLRNSSIIILLLGFAHQYILKRKGLHKPSVSLSLDTFMISGGTGGPLSPSFWYSNSILWNVLSHLKMSSSCSILRCYIYSNNNAKLAIYHIPFFHVNFFPYALGPNPRKPRLHDAGAGWRPQFPTSGGVGLVVSVRRHAFFQLTWWQWFKIVRVVPIGGLVWGVHVIA